MADNVVASAGSGGATFASDDIGGVQFPRVKLIHGADNINDGDVSTANPLPVDVREIGGAAAPIGAGVEATAVRVTVATDSTGVLSVDDNGGSLTIDNAGITTIAGAVSGAEMQVDVVAPLPAGTNAIGKLAANSGVDIGDVDVTSLPSTVHSADYDTGAGTDTTLAFGIAVPAVGGAAVVPGDATAGLKVDLGADNDVTVTGSVTANAGTNLNTSALALETGGNLAGAATSLAIIDDWDETDRAKVNLIVGQAGIAAGAGAVGVNVPRMTLASDDPAVALLGTIDADTGSIATSNAAIQTAVETIDNAISGTEMQVDVVASLPAGTNTIGDVGIAPRTSGGCSIFRSIDLDETEEEIKATAGQVYGMIVFNLTASVLYLKFYNATAATVVVGTTTPVMTIPIPSPGNTSGAGFVFNLPQGIAFSTAITAAVTTGLADADVGAPAANAAIVQVFYA